MSKTEKFKSSIVAKKIAVTAMLSALSAILMFISFPVPALIPFFIKMDFSELPALVAAFVVSPWSGAAVCLVKNLINMLFSTTGCVGELCNFILGALMVVPAGLIYRRKKTRKTAIVACLCGSVIMAAASVLVNYYISYPVYFAVSAPEEAIMEMYQAINPNVSNLWQALLWFNAPFTLVKGLLVSAITFLVYKPLSNGLKNFW